MARVSTRLEPGWSVISFRLSPLVTEVQESDFDHSAYLLLQDSLEK
jgi:hypothetical protein